jgi:hypothetical protein
MYYYSENTTRFQKQCSENLVQCTQSAPLYSYMIGNTQVSKIPNVNSTCTVVRVHVESTVQRTWFMFSMLLSTVWSLTITKFFELPNCQFYILE